MELENKKYIILTGGEGGYGNLGDEWLLDSVKFRYKKLVKKYKVIILMAKPPKISLGRFVYVVDSLESLKKRNIPMSRVAAIHYYGGGYLNSYWIKEKIWLYNYFVNSGFPNSKIIFTGVGLGPFENDELSLIKPIVNNVAYFGKRDNYLASEIAGDFMFDESVVLASSYKPVNNKRTVIWVNFRIAEHAGFTEEKAALLIRQVEVLAESKNLVVKYFAMIKGPNLNEKAEITRILKKYKIKRQVVGRARGYASLLKQFNNAAMVVTTSYHATLASLYTNTPVVAVYANEYYRIKFSGLKDVLDSSLLSIQVIDDSLGKSLGVTLTESDKNIRKKIVGLKKMSDRAYNRYMEILSE